MLLIFVVKSHSEILKCDFKNDFAFRSYGCDVKDFNMSIPNQRISGIEGHHSVGFSIDDIETLRIENQHKYKFFSNDFFAKFSFVKNLIIHQTSLQYLMKGDFILADHLLVIHITHNELTDLEDYTFYGTKKLKMLNLRENKIRMIAENALKGLMTLKYLTLSYNRIEDLHVNTFKELNYLEHLSLSSNHIQHIDVRLLSKNRNLEVIFLDNNRLKAVSGKIFQNNVKLREIYMDNNQLKHIPESEHFLSNLKFLEVAVFTNNTCVDSMIFIMNQLFPPYRDIFQNC